MSSFIILAVLAASVFEILCDCANKQTNANENPTPTRRLPPSWVISQHLFIVFITMIYVGGNGQSSDQTFETKTKRLASRPVRYVSLLQSAHVTFD